MTAATDAVSPRRRRLDTAVARLRAAPPSAGTETPDAAVAVLHAMYDVWEAWRKEQRLRSLPEQDAIAGMTDDGQVAAALIYARGLGTHRQLEVGANPGFGLQPFGVTPFGGGWYWVPGPEPGIEEPNQRKRSAWYDQHVKYQAVLRPVEKAHDWFIRHEVPGAP